ncbi:MAG: hypothetical protein WC509_04580 [Candidatus Izemoplasmatales bacterium]
MPNSFTMEYDLAGRTAKEIYAKVSQVKTIGKMTLDFEQPEETRMIYVQPTTVWKDGFKALVVFHDHEGGSVHVAIRSQCNRSMVIFDGGQNEKNCVAIRNAIAAALK